MRISGIEKIVIQDEIDTYCHQIDKVIIKRIIEKVFPMKIAFVFFYQMTTLDFVVFYDAVTQLKTMGFIDHLSWTLCGTKNEIYDDRGIASKIQEVAPDLSQ